MKASLWIAALAAIPAASAQATSISIANPVIPTYPTNYTTVGTYDWSHYGYDNGGSTGAYYDYDSGGPNSISNLTPVGPGTVTPYGSYVGLTATWTNGEFNNETNNQSFDYNGNNATGDGLQFNAIIPALTTETLQVYVVDYNGNGISVATFAQLEASISADSLSTTNTGPLVIGGTGGAPAGNSAHGYGEYAITVTNTDSTADTLNVQFTQTFVGETNNGNVSIFGVTAQVVPEPAALGLVGFAAGAVALRRRRRP